MSRPWIRVSLLIALTYCAAVGTWCYADSKRPAGDPDKPRTNEKNTELLGGADRYLTFLSTDKPIYKAGEKVYARGVMLNAANHKPLAQGMNGNATIEIKGPKGDVVGGGSVQTADSAWGFGWDVPEGQAGGEYTIKVTYPWEGHAPAERKFDIRAYRAPRLKSQITFLRDGYGPGDKVSATLDVKRAEGGVPEGAKVSVIASVDGIEITGASAKVDSQGLCSVAFQLPNDIPRGEGTLSLVIEDGGVVETAAKSIPIILQTVDLQIYPEGGDLVAGYSNRVYIEAKQPNGKPADLVGKVVSKDLSPFAPSASFRTEHEGRGRFEFTPEANKEYFLSISEPAGIKKLFPLPQVKTTGAVVRADKDVFEKNQPVTAQVGCVSKSFRVSLSKKEVEIAAYKVGSNERRGRLVPVSLAVPADVDGVLTLTVWNEKNEPIAERLVFRQPAKPLHITITPDKGTYVPGDNTKVTVKTTDGNGKPVSAVVGLTVSDDTVLEMVDKREQAPRLPVMLFLEPEVTDLADAHVYLDPKNPKAPLATDLLLGTQGWRRFALMDIAKFVEAHGDKARRAVALKMQCDTECASALAVDNIGFANEGAARGGAMPMPPMLAMAVPVPNVIPKPGARPAPIPAPQKAAAPEASASGILMKKADAQKEENAQFAQAVMEPEGKVVREQQNFKSLAKDSDRDMPKEKLRRALNGAAMGAPALFDKRQRMSAPLSTLILVREFAHQVRNDRKPTDRTDFTETLYWNAGVKTDAATGEATVSFGLNDSVSTFRVFADAFAGDGAIGADNTVVKSIQPFYAEAKLPLEVSAGDQILLPISLVNSTDGALSSGNVSIDLKGEFKLAALEGAPDTLASGERVRCIQPINVGFGNGTSTFILNAKAGEYGDNVTRQLSVKPKGFPIETTFGGMLEPGKKITHIINIPEGVVPRSMLSTTAVYPTPLANLTEALQRMIQDPSGCFEQTSSTSYPLTMAQQYFLSHTGIDPKMVETSRQKLDVGYKMLTGFWCPDKGYEWFGENPGHEALTAFGLLHFADMAKVREVDQNMVASTRGWLLKQRDGQGGFSRKRRSLHTWTEDKDCSNAYIVWAMLETGQPAADLKAELDSLRTASAVSKNNYVVALAANALYLAGDKPSAEKLMKRLVAKQKPDGSFDDVTSSIVGSGGESLEVEGTALSTLALLREPAYAGSVEKSIKFLADSCQSGRYGSTQATVLALRAIVNYDKQRAHPKAPGAVRIFVDGQQVGDAVAFDESTKGAIKMPDLSELLSPGEHKVELAMESGGKMPYSLAVKYNALTPVSAKECKLDIAVKMAQPKLIEGAATEATAIVSNNTKDVLPSPVAIIGLPGGLEPRHDQLKELVKKGTIDAYEVRGREVVLYWRTLPGNAKVSVPLSLIAAVPGTYTGPASRAYLYYTDEHKQWVDGVQVEIAAKQQIARHAPAPVAMK